MPPSTEPITIPAIIPGWDCTVDEETDDVETGDEETDEGAGDGEGGGTKFVVQIYSSLLLISSSSTSSSAPFV